MVKVEFSPWCCRIFTTVASPLHHGGVFTAPWWSFYGTMVEWHRHRGVFPDFTTVKNFLHHGDFSKSLEERSKIRKELTPPWWRSFDFWVEFSRHRGGGLLILRRSFFNLAVAFRFSGMGGICASRLAEGLAAVEVKQLVPPTLRE